MPYKLSKVRGKDLYKVVNSETKEIKSSGSSKQDAKKQISLLRSLERKERKGGALKASQLKDSIDLTYKKDELQAPKGYEVDKELSNDRTKVFKDLNSNQVIVAHRGSKGWRDWFDNVRYGLSGNIKGTGTYKIAKKNTDKAVQKYGADNIILVGHSRAGKYAEEYNKDKPVKEVLTYNKAIALQDAFQKNPANQTDVRSSRDVVSVLQPLQQSANKAVNIGSNTFNLLKAHGTSALGKLGDKLIGKGVKKGDRMIGGSVWTDFVKEFALKHSLKYACALSKWKEQLKKAYKLKKEGKDWYEPITELKPNVVEPKPNVEGGEFDYQLEGGEFDYQLEGGNRWTDFVKEYAKKLETTYGCALSDIAIKPAYKLFKEGKEWYIPKPSPLAVDEYVEPEPTKAPENIVPVINRIEDKIVELEQAGAKAGAVSYSPATLITDIAFVNLLKKYGGKCIVANIMKASGVDMGIDVNNNPSKSDIRIRVHYQRLGELLQDCIERGVQVICIPLSLQFGKSSSGHANMLVYRPFKRIVERFEPHGTMYGNSESDNTSFNKQLKQLWEVDLKEFIGDVRYRDPDEICPYTKGFQSLENELKALKQEGGGFCSMWSFFFAEMVFLNPDKSSKDILNEVFDITKKEPQYLKSVIRGYVLEIEKGLNELLQVISKTGFSFKLKNPFQRIRENVSDLTEWIVSVIFDSKNIKDAPPNFEPLPDVAVKVKSDTDTLKEDLYNKLAFLNKNNLIIIFGLYGKLSPKGKKEDIIKRYIQILIDEKLKDSGSIGVGDVDIILKEQLYKLSSNEAYRLANKGYFKDYK